MKMKKTIKYLLIVVGATAVAMTALSAMTISVSLPLPGPSITVHRSVMTDIIAVPDSASIAASAKLESGRYALNESGVRAELTVPKGGSIATLQADRFAFETTSLANDMVRIKALPGPGTVTFSPAIRLAIAADAAIDIKSVSLDETGRTAEAQIKLAIARSLFNIAAGSAVADPDTADGGVTFIRKLIHRIIVDRFACTFRQGAEIRLNKDQVFVVGTRGSAELYGVTIAGPNSVSGSFKAELPLASGTRITGPDFMVRPETARLAISGTYRRQSGVEDLRVHGPDKSDFLAMKGVVANFADKPVVRVDSLRMSSGEFSVHQSNGARQITIGGKGDLAADIADAPFPGGSFLLSGLKSELAFKLTSDGKGPTFTGSMNSVAAATWRVRVQPNSDSKVEVGGSAIKFQNIAFADLGAVTLSLPAGEIRPTTASFANKRGSVDVVMDQRSAVAITGQQPIQFGLSGTSAIAIGDVQLSGTFPSLIVHVASRHQSAKDCSGNVRLITAGKLRAMGEFQMTVDGSSIGRNLEQVLGNPSRFNMNDLKVTGLSCSSGDANLKAVFDISGADEGIASVKIRVPNGFRVNASGSGLRDSRLDASFVGHGFDADIDLDRGEAKTTLEFDLVNRNRVSPLTVHADVSTSPWTQFTARAWIFIKPFTVSLRVGSTVRLAEDGRVTVRLDSWVPTDPRQGIDLDSDTHKMSGVHGTIRPINVARFKMHANYIGDFWFDNPLPHAVDGVIGRDIVLRP